MQSPEQCPQHRTQQRIGLIGLGIMGAAMAHNLLRAGFPVTVFNRTARRMEPLLEAGAAAATSPADVARQADVVITMVTDSPDVEHVVFGKALPLAPDRVASSLT